QIALIKAMCIEKNVCCILLNQVRAVMNDKAESVLPVAKVIVDHWSNFNIGIENTDGKERKIKVLSKDKTILSITCKLTDKGLSYCEENRL
ncbi:MAG: hypothetical protein ACTSQY_06655, partial [Candidatus Odinarchaeia archaeon]